MSMNIDQILNQIKIEEERNSLFLHLTANENQLSNTARKFLGSKLNERYYFGGGNENSVVNMGHFTALGYKGVNHLVKKAGDAAESMLSACSVNLSVLSGVHAMMSAILASTDPGDTVMTVPLEAGGHFATKGIIERTGRKHIFAEYDFSTQKFNTQKIAKIIKLTKTKAIYLDISYYLNPVNLKEIRSYIGEKPVIIYDASHTLGLIMGQQFQSPLREGANIISANTHKTMPGPHKGLIAFRDQDLADKANAIINSCLFSTSHTAHLIALAITLLEMKRYGKDYAKQIISNSNAIGEAFDKLGYQVKKANTGRYSENHQCHIFIEDKGQPLDLYNNLIRSGISTNFEGFEFNNGKWFIRIGVAEVTRRGMKEKEMKKIANLIDRSFKGENVKNDVLTLNQKFTKIHYSFDDQGLVDKLINSIL